MGEAFVRVFEPADVVEVAQVRMVLDGAGIPYRIANEHYLHTGGGIYSLGDTQVFVVVPESRAAEAVEHLEDWFGGSSN